MIPKLKRIQKKQEISRLFKARLCVYTDSFNLKVGVGVPDFGNRLLVVVSKKIFKRANKRNKLKCRLMHIFDEVFLKESGSRDFFLVVKQKDLIELSPQCLEGKILDLHQRYLKEKVKFLKNKNVEKVQKHSTAEK